MDREELYRILDIERPEEFTFYENMASLLEEDRQIDTDLLEELITSVDKEECMALLESYFREFLSRLPDDLTDLYITIDLIQRELLGCDDSSSLAEALARFRKWYVTDTRVLDRQSGLELSVRDARYDLAASAFTGEECDYDFTNAYEYAAEGYNVGFRQLVEDQGEY